MVNPSDTRGFIRDASLQTRSAPPAELERLYVETYYTPPVFEETPLTKLHVGFDQRPFPVPLAVSAAEAPGRRVEKASSSDTAAPPPSEKDKELPSHPLEHEETGSL